MAKKKQKTLKDSPSAIGRRVKFKIGALTITGRIVEDRGAVGHLGRHLYRIAQEDKSIQSEDVTTFELPADQIAFAN